MAASTWTYSDWVTYEIGTSGRLSRLRLHIQEVADKISAGNQATEQKSHDYGLIQQYLRDLRVSETAEAAAVALNTNRAPFVRGRALP